MTVDLMRVQFARQAVGCCICKTCRLEGFWATKWHQKTLTNRDFLCIMQCVATHGWCSCSTYRTGTEKSLLPDQRCNRAAQMPQQQDLKGHLTISVNQSLSFETGAQAARASGYSGRDRLMRRCS